MGRTSSGVVASMILLAAILAFVPGPLQIIAALIALPIGATIFAGTDSLNRKRL
jgi:predicted branched-subunit amino acid permease